MRNSPFELFPSPSADPLPRSFFIGCAAAAAGDRATAEAELEQARVFYEKAVDEIPNNASRHAYLGLVNAFLGRKEEALRASRTATELMPE